MLEEQVLTCFTRFTGTKVQILTAEEAALAAMLEEVCFASIFYIFYSVE
jgi:hypothetical protein